MSEAVDRAYRLRTLKQSPGFGDLVRIGEALVRQATDALVNFPGWDKDQIATLKARAQAASEYHDRLFAVIEETISLGNSEMKDKHNGVDSEAIREMMRGIRPVLVPNQEQTTETENRIPGSY